MAEASFSNVHHIDSPIQKSSTARDAHATASRTSHEAESPSGLVPEPTSTPGRPTEQMQVEQAREDDIQYPTGPQLWLNLIAVLLVSFLHGLDLTIVAVTVPSLTNHFKTLDDIGWYSAVYGLMFSSTNFFFGKMYTVFDLKKMYITSIVIFELGSLFCTFASSSKVFVLGRALAGVGAAGLGAGAMVFIPRCFPNHKRPIITGVFGFAQSFGLVSAPIIGGALVDAFTWRACFGINIPIGAVAVVITALFLKDPLPNPNINLPFHEKLKRTDPLGTVLIIPSIICLMMAIQWGGTRYSWGDWRIILLIILFVSVATVFAYVQNRQRDRAILPPSILKNRTVLASALFNCCTNGLLATTEYYIAIYFQGVKGFTATKAGILGLPMIVGLSVCSILAAVATTWIGYYTPFLFATGIVAPIASGLLTTIDLDDSPAKVAILLCFVGVGVGFGSQAPLTATMTVMNQKEVSIALGVLAFGGGMGSSLFVATSAALFQNRLSAEISRYAPGINVTSIDKAGLSDIRRIVPSDRLKETLFGYNEAVIQTLYLPLSLALLTLVGAAFTEVRSVKKKQQ